jgi:hypothetical protein
MPCRLSRGDIALLRGVERLARRLRRCPGALRHLVDGHRQRLDGCGDLARLARLGLRALGHAAGRVGHLVRADRHVHGGHAHVGDDGADLGDHEVDGVDHVAEHVGGDLAALRQVALGHLHRGVEELDDVLLQLLAAAALLVAVRLGLDLRAEPNDGVIERLRQLADLVPRGDRDGLAEIALADSVRGRHELRDGARDAPGEEDAAQQREGGHAAEEQQQLAPRRGRGLVDDGPVHTDAHRADLAGCHGHADVDDLPRGLPGRVLVLDVPLLAGHITGDDILVHDVDGHGGREGVRDEPLLRVVDHDVGDAADPGELVHEGLHGGRVARRDQVHPGRGQARRDGLALGRELLGHAGPDRPRGDVPRHCGQRNQRRHEEQDDFA